MTAPSPLEIDRAIALRMRRTWPAFFDRFGRLTEVQRAAIPAILQGSDVLVVAATASGKTEAACAPLIERLIGRKEPWTILYVSPTRALVNDLYARLWSPMNQLGLELARRTGDHRDASRDAHIILTTPESFDSMLCRGRAKGGGGHLLANVRCVVLDEVHLLFGSARGDQVRWLLERLRRMRRQARDAGWSRDLEIQVVALSATISEPAEVSRAYLRQAEVVQVEGGRSIETVAVESSVPTVEEALPQYLQSAPPEKILVFSNARRRVDDLTSWLRERVRDLKYEVRAHHGSLGQRERESTEEALKSGTKVIVCATSTLELGIDIGDIDLVVLDGPAPDMRALLQRVGRGNRRTNRTRVMSCAGSVLETVVHAAMIESARDGWLGGTVCGPQYAVARQQVASYIFQSPRRSRSRNAVEDLIGECLSLPESITILDKMIEDRELHQDQEGLRLGDFWLDLSSTGAIHSNIEDPPGLEVVDEETGHTIASGIRHQTGGGLRAGGLLLEARRWTDMKLEVRRVRDEARAQGDWGYVSRRWMRGADHPQAVRRYLGVAADEWPVVEHGLHSYVFHFGGPVTAAAVRLIASLDQEHIAITCNEWYLAFPRQRAEKQDWLTSPSRLDLDVRMMERLGALERDLGRPRANSTLPERIRLAEVSAWLQIDHELERIRDSRWVPVRDDAMIDVLRDLVGALGD